MALHDPYHTTSLCNGDLPYTLREVSRIDESKFFVNYETTLPAAPAVFDAFPSNVPVGVANFLMPNGRRPYSHQALAADLFLRQGKNVALVTPPASGKTVSFLASVLSTLDTTPGSTALMIYPMNALATDQMKVLKTLGFQEEKSGLYEITLGNTVVRAGVLNGESGAKLKKAIRTSANLVITNHVSLHHGILEQCNRAYKDASGWGPFLSGLAAVVIDEGHSYNGVPGTNAALAFRRLFMVNFKRSGAYPRVLVASATIGNPLEHAKNLTGLDDWALVDVSGAATYDRHIKVCVPSLHPSMESLWHASMVVADIAQEEVTRGHRVLIFCPSRSGTEKMADRLNTTIGPGTALPFHAGLAVEAKREFLQQILNGHAQVVCATSALELGVDIGGMDTVILHGHPGDQASFSQRAGRVGRTSTGWVYLVLDENQNSINTFLMGNPEAIHWPPESRTVYPANPNVATKHAACAYLETKDEDMVHQFFPSVKDEEVQAAMSNLPYQKIAMVGKGNYGQFRVLTPDQKVIQELGGETALLHWFRGASVRSPWGAFFTVIKVDTAKQSIYTIPASPGRYTTPVISTTHTLIEGTLMPLTSSPIPGVTNAFTGGFRVSRYTLGYTASALDPSGPDTSQSFMLAPEDLNPAITISTRGAMVTLDLKDTLAEAIFSSLGGAQMVADAMAQTVGLLVQARGADVPVIFDFDEESMSIFIFDMADGGMGWAEQLVHRLGEWLRLAGTLIMDCSCHLRGCPRCSFAPSVGAERKALAEALTSTPQISTNVRGIMR